MDAVNPVLNAFPFIQAGHPFYARLQGIAEFLDEQLAFRCFYARAQDASRQIAHTEIKGVQLENGVWNFDRFYWALQIWDKNADAPKFDAFTLYHRPATGEMAYYEFPVDPYLSALSSYFSDDEDRLESTNLPKVLRYVPLRRFTFRTAASKQGSLIGKFKRFSRYREAYSKLDTVARAVNPRSAGFTVPAPAGLDEKRGLFFQTAEQGIELTGLMDTGNYRWLLQRVGRLHKDIHRQTVPGLPTWNFTNYIKELYKDIHWITFFRPDLETRFQNVRRLLGEHTPAIEPEKFCFCHGDFACSQILTHDEHYTVVDFELCRLGDPYQEIGMLLASLSYDVHLFDTDENSEALLESAAEAYLDGYQEANGERIDQQRLTWFRAAAEIYYLTLRLKKGRYDESGFNRGVARIEGYLEAVA